MYFRGDIKLLVPVFSDILQKMTKTAIDFFKGMQKALSFKWN